MAIDSTLTQIANNAQAFIDALTGFGTLLWPALLIVGLILLVLMRRKDGLILALAPLPLVAAIAILSSTVYLRYYATALPLWLLLGGAGLGLALDRLPRQAWRQTLSAAVIGLLAWGIVPFAIASYTDPGHLTLPQLMRWQYLTEHSAGFGLREAALDLPNTIGRPDVSIIASMFADSCRRTNLYAPDGFALICTSGQGRADIDAALNEQGAAYVLVDRFTGMDVTTVDGQATSIAAYPRPGETSETASVVLWLIEDSH
jgi:hypothetical protein